MRRAEPSIWMICLLLALMHSSVWADLNLKGGKFNTDNSTSTSINFDPDQDGTNESILDAGGNLGLGTLAPGANVHVVGNAYVSGELILGGNLLNTDGSLYDGLVGWWSFDDGSGTSTSDLSGLGNNGTLTNGPTWMDGKFSNGIRFDGVDDYVDAGSDSSIINANDYTISCWIKPDVDLSSMTNWTGIVMRGNFFDGLMRKSSTGGNVIIAYATHTGGVVNVSSTTKILANNWYHVAMTADNSTIKIFINGSEENSEVVPNPLSAPSGNFQIGLHRTGNSEYFDGIIDEVRSYNRALSEKEIYVLYTHGQAKLATGGTISDNLIVTGNVGITSTVHLNTVSAPSSPVTGQVFSAGTNLQFYNGTEWKSLSAGGSSVWTQPGSGNLLYSSGSVNVGSVADQVGVMVVGNGGSSDNILSLNDNGVSALSVADGGYIGIGKATPTQLLDVVGTAGFGATTVTGNITISDNIMPSTHLSYDIGTNASSLNAAYAVDYFLMSDKRLKAGVHEIQGALEKIDQLRPVTFKFNSDLKQTRLGLIAQEVERIVPEAVNSDDHGDRIKGVSYHELTVLLLAAQKEEMAEIDEKFSGLYKRLERIKQERKAIRRTLRANNAGGNR